MNALRRFPAEWLRLTALGGCLALASATGAAAGSRVFVSATLNSTIQVFDSETYAEVQPPLGSRGGGPVRLWLEKIDGKSYLFAANHGAPVAPHGSLGVFDLSSAPIAVELPLSPFFTGGAGSVGVVAGTAQVGTMTVPLAFVTNTWFALGGCSMPTGSVTGFDLSLLSSAGIAQRIDTSSVSGSIPYAVAMGPDGSAYVSGNCSNKLDTVSVGATETVPDDLPVALRFSMTLGASRDVGKGPDATLYDRDNDLIFVNNISGGSVSVYDATSATALTTVPLHLNAAGKSSGPIDANPGVTKGGRPILVTSNGSDDSVSVIDRSIAKTCAAAHQVACPDAEVAWIKTAVPGGAPEGIDFDPTTNRIFTVNKNIASPTLSVIQLCEQGVGDGCPGGAAIGGSDVHQIPIVGLDAAAPVPALIAFDVVVEKP